ncbi:uncharacterized protein LOC108631311 [Ceratina calcarata]|uniref:Odorant receptor n=1 Tax=Ceratina calcarata TaxID=156304 RepID=A0AAJ7JD45_9HYME|nr:uncharacterized protein LOC108631311 [Ceratina calcarata]
MFDNVTPERAISFTKYSVIVTALWPLPPTATKFERIRYTALRTFFTMNAISLLLALLNAIRVHKESPMEVTRAVQMSSALFMLLANTVSGVYQYDRFQRVLEEVKNYLENAELYERSVLQKYIDNHCALYGVLGVWVYVSALVFIVGFIPTPDPMPCNAVYPFRIDHEPLHTIVLLHQCVAALQIVSNLNLNIQTALLTFFSAARFEILMIKMRDVKDAVMLATCMAQYHDIKRFAREVIAATLPYCFITVASSFFVVIFSAVCLFVNLPDTMKIQFCMHCISGLTETFICALPCDYLMNMSGNVMSGLYESDWYNRARELKMSILIGLTPQAPLIVKIPGLLSGLTLSFFSSFLSNVFSMFTVMRVMMIGDD